MYFNGATTEAGIVTGTLTGSLCNNGKIYSNYYNSITRISNNVCVNSNDFGTKKIG